MKIGDYVFLAEDCQLVPKGTKVRISYKSGAYALVRVPNDPFDMMVEVSKLIKEVKVTPKGHPLTQIFK